MDCTVIFLAINQLLLVILFICYFTANGKHAEFFK